MASPAWSLLHGSILKESVEASLPTYYFSIFLPIAQQSETWNVTGAWQALTMGSEMGEGQGGLGSDEGLGDQEGA